METSELQALTVKELQQFAKNLKAEDLSGLRKQDLIKLILVKQAEKKGDYFCVRNFGSTS